MLVIEKIELLMKAKGWTVNKLALEADLTASTLYSMMSRKADPSISTLSMLCNALEVSLSDFFKTDVIFTKDEELLVKDYRSLNSTDKDTIKYLAKRLNRK